MLRLATVLLMVTDGSMIFTAVLVALPPGIEASVEKQTLITIRGVDKYLVGQVAANLRACKPPEPYKGKGIKYTGEVIIRKEGKTGK